MPLDYGQRQKSRAKRGLWAGLATGLLAVGVLASVNWTYQRHRERAQGWVTDGPPCAALSAQAYAAKGYAAHERAAVYEGVTFARQFGHVACATPDTGTDLGLVTHPVCQYTSPAAVRVKTAAAEAFFEPGPGEMATVSIEKGRIRCQLGGRFTLWHDGTYSVPG
jgi:hypothetical protein